jgi:hypothetical protein
MLSNILLFITGILGGLAAINIPELYLNVKEVKLFEVLNFFLTLILGISIPLIVKKWIEDNRYIKSSLVGEINKIIENLDKIKIIVSDCYHKGTITSDEKNIIVYVFDDIDLQLNCLRDLLSLSFKKRGERLYKDLKESYFLYYDYLTGGELMKDSFTKIDISFYSQHGSQTSDLGTKFKNAVHQIHKL